MNEQELQLVLDRVEKLLISYGAVPAGKINSGRDDTTILRPAYEYKGTYFRTESAVLDGVPVIIINGIDDEGYARVGIDDALTAFPASSSDEQINSEIRKLLELDG